MPAFTQKLTLAVERLMQDQWSVTGRTVAYQVFTATLLNADRANDQIQVLSADLSAQAIPLTPLGVSAPGQQQVLVFDQPVDIRTNAANDTNFLSHVTVLALQGYLSGIYVTTGSALTTMWTNVAGGSNASPQWTFPLP